MACLKKCFFLETQQDFRPLTRGCIFPRGLFNRQQIQTNLKEKNFVFVYTVTKGTALKCLVNCTVLCKDKSSNCEQSQKLLTKQKSVTLYFKVP